MKIFIFIFFLQGKLENIIFFFSFHQMGIAVKQCIIIISLFVFLPMRKHKMLLYKITKHVVAHNGRVRYMNIMHWHFNEYTFPSPPFSYTGTQQNLSKMCDNKEFQVDKGDSSVNMFHIDQIMCSLVFLKQPR